jgi:membrane protease subunit HflK
MSTSNQSDPPQEEKKDPASNSGGSDALDVQDAGTQALSEALSSSFKIVKVLMVLLVAAFFLSGLESIKSNEEAVKLRFGRASSSETMKPGFHWAFPYPVDEIVRIPVRESHRARATNGWYAVTPEMEALGQLPPAYDTLQPGLDGYTLTSDGNIIHARVTIGYQISDAVRYGFQFANFTNLLDNVLNNALVYASARFTAEDAIYKNKLGFKDLVENRIREKVAQTGLGIEVELAEVETSAPLYVAEKFADVQAAEQNRSKTISEAQGYASEVGNIAQGQIAEIIRGGIAESNRVVLSVSAEADYFKTQLPSYLRDPQLFKERLHIQTFEEIFINAQEKHWIPNNPDGTSKELRLQLSREPQKAKSDNP